MIERNEVDLMLAHHHPVLNLGLDGRQFSHLVLASDRLVPVARAAANGVPVHTLLSGKPAPMLASGPILALGRLVEDHIANNALMPPLERRVECDSADALLEYALRGLGIAWLPWSMVHQECKSGRLARAGDRRMEVRMEVRLYRAKRRQSALVEAVWKSMSRVGADGP